MSADRNGIAPAAARWWETRRFAAVLIVAVAIPLLLPRIPPLLDLPGHMGSYAVSLSTAGSALRRYYSLDWRLIGNLGVDLLILPVGKILGVEAGTKLIVILIPVLSAVGLLWAAVEVHGKLPATAAFALPLVYCYPLFFGFVNYCLGMAFALLAFALWLRLARRSRTILHAILFAAFAVAIWTTHAIAWAALALMCFASEFEQALADRLGLVRALVRAGVRCIPLGVPILLVALTDRAGKTSASGWLDPSELVKSSIGLMRDRWLVLDIACALVIAAVLAVAAARRGGLRLLPRLIFPAGALAIAYVLLPKSINGSDFVGSRLVPYAAALALLSIDADRLGWRARQAWALLACLFFTVRIGSNALSTALYDAAWERHLPALEVIPRGSAVASFYPQHCRTTLAQWYNNRLAHLGAMALVRRDAFTNGEWTIPGLQLLRSTYPQAGNFQGDQTELVMIEPCPTTYIQRFDTALATLPRSAFQFVWLIGIPRALWPHVRWLEPVWRTDDAILYRIKRGG